jgi:hypothetical protein
MSSQQLHTLAQTAAAAPTDANLVGQLLRAVNSLAATDREQALAAIMTSLATHDPDCRLLQQLAASADRPARLLALELAVLLPPSPAVLSILRPLLCDPDLPLGLQFAVVRKQPRWGGPNGPGTVELLYALVRGLAREQALQRLEAIQSRLGKIAALAQVRQRVGTPLGPRCPRCGEEWDQPALRRHLWDAHRLVVEGDLVREPWAVIEDWVLAATGNPDRLARCFELAMQLDGDRGLARLEGMIAQLSPDGSPVPVKEAGGSTSLSPCPRCGTAARVPGPLPIREITLTAGRLLAGGYRVEITENGLAPRLEVATPDRMIHQGREPGRLLTSRGLTLLLVGPPVVLALVLALFQPAPRVPVTLCLLLALVGYGLVLLGGYLREQLLDRTVNHAWALLAPQLHRSGFSLDDAAFLGGLASVSSGHGRPGCRDRSLEWAISRTEQALGHHPGAVAHLVHLGRLAIEDSEPLRRDPAALAARLLVRCLEGALPLSLADRLLADWDSALWTPGNRARLRVLLCKLAFADDLNVAQLREAGRLAPALGQLLGERELLLDLQRLHALRSARPWERCGEALTVFELAEQAGVGSRYLAACPDLLLCQFLTGRQAESGLEAILVCGRGVVVGQSVHRQRPLHLDPAQAALANTVGRWLDFYLGEWAGQPADEGEIGAGWREKLQLPEARVCAGCGLRFLTRPGETGIALNKG